MEVRKVAMVPLTKVPVWLTELLKVVISALTTAPVWLTIGVFLVSYATAQQPPSPPQAPQLSRPEGLLFLADLVDNQFGQAARVLAATPESNFNTDTTYLVPSDVAMQVSAQSPSSPQLYEHVRIHFLVHNLSMDDLHAMPQGTWLPSRIPNRGVQITDNSASSLSLNNAQIVKPNICPDLAVVGITCHGINQVLDENSRLSPMPAGTQSTTPPATQASSPSPPATQVSSPTPPVTQVSSPSPPATQASPPPPPPPSPPPPPPSPVATPTPTAPSSPSTPTSTVGNVTNTPTSSSSTRTPADGNTSSGTPFGLSPSLLGPVYQSLPNRAMRMEFSSTKVFALLTFACVACMFV
ncbi:hypothetical protein KP509_13G083300 [Ceratopteris richardii]|uniref:FAS1 domain-containing protein n=1 Tax=Ceratopteris richardii TaxID=49495 RepID=A0A8T2TKP7_CERRI|nr:hypothetical protein KP509_13G083300 [Ceratopteris richardii]